MAVLDADAPLVNRQTVWQPLVSRAGHGKPGIGETPAERRVLLAIVHVAVDALAIYFFHVLAEEFSDVFIGGPVHRHAKLVAVTLFELLFQLWPFKPVGTKPVEVREL